MSSVTNPVVSRRPSLEDIDVYGVTHTGRVRPINADHFLIASLHKTMEVHQTSLPPDMMPPATSNPRGFLVLVADGVGRGVGGGQAARTALASVAAYVTEAMGLCVRIDPANEPRFITGLRTAVEQTHAEIRAAAAENPAPDGMATTLTMVTVVWPRAYVVHVGDSRAYRLRDGRLERLTRDQTMAQAMLEAGAITEEQAERSGLKHVLWSAVGGSEAAPEVTVVDCDWDDMMLVCSDGVTKHVSDEELRDHMLRLPTSAAVAEALLALALDRGGSDNITVVAGRLRARG